MGGAAVVAAPVAGKAADRYGHRRVMSLALWAFALGLLPTLVTTNKLFIAAIVPVAFAAVVLITLPYALMMRLLPEHHHHGAGAGLFGMSRGIGVLVGPVLAGLAIEHTARLDVLSFGATQGYSAIFGVTSALLLASLPILRRIA